MFYLLIKLTNLTGFTILLSLIKTNSDAKMCSIMQLSFKVLPNA